MTSTIAESSLPSGSLYRSMVPSSTRTVTIRRPCDGQAGQGPHGGGPEGRGDGAVAQPELPGQMRRGRHVEGVQVAPVPHQEAEHGHGGARVPALLGHAALYGV